VTPAFEIQNWNPKSEIQNSEFQDPMLNTFVVHVENKPGVLTRVSSLFRRRAFNIDSLTVGRTEKPEVSRMTITVEADVDQARRIEANLYKLVNVLLVENVTDEPIISRDLALIKISANQETRDQVLGLVNVFRARVLDVAASSITIEITGNEEKIDRLVELITPFGILEMVRTGIVAMRRGKRTVAPGAPLEVLNEVSEVDDEAMSV
jgi:acetolactate synthase-1/3 small subunit